MPVVASKVAGKREEKRQLGSAIADRNLIWRAEGREGGRRLGERAGQKWLGKESDDHALRARALRKKEKGKKKS